jgi:cytochrome c peroxidase
LIFVVSDAARASDLSVEYVRALKHSPLPPMPVDASNTVEHSVAARRLGERLFRDVRLSNAANLSCMSCHDPQLGWSDGRPVATNGQVTGQRRSPSLRNIGYQRWFNWDGSADSLWSQVLGPIESPKEMGGDRRSSARLVTTDSAHRADFEAAFGSVGLRQCEDASATGEAGVSSACFRNIGLALAAYVKTIVSLPNRFDRFVEHVRAGGAPEQGGLAADELQGLRLFFGVGKCFTCHTGPLFSNGEFHNLAIAPTIPRGATDSGRLGGVKRLLRNEFNLLSIGTAPPDHPIRYLEPRDAFWGQFKTPSLRNAAMQSYFMHHGQFSSLREVVRFYSELIGIDTSDHHRELSLMPLRLTLSEQDALVRFLQLLAE